MKHAEIRRAETLEIIDMLKDEPKCQRALWLIRRRQRVKDLRLLNGRKA